MPTCFRSHTAPKLAMLLGGLAVGLPACSESATAPEAALPTVVTLERDAVGSFDPAEYKITCLEHPGPALAVATACPVLSFEGRSYWALSYRDNRSSMAIHAFDDTGGTTGLIERAGARYVYDIEIDEVAQTVTFRGQADRVVTVTWEELRAIR